MDHSTLGVEVDASGGGIVTQAVGERRAATEIHVQDETVHKDACAG